MKSNLLTAWSGWIPSQPPYMLEDDRIILESTRSSKAVKTFKSWQSAYKSEDFAAPGDTRLHLGILPHPFCGDVMNAEIYILLLNPGLGPYNYFAEYEVSKYRDVVISNLKQHLTSDVLPFYHLDPQFSWHGGFTWWHGKLSAVIEDLALSRKVSFAEARSELGKKIASIELLPYHSTSFRDADHWVRDLQSVKLAHQFVNDYVLSRVKKSKAIVIVTRQTKVWNLPQHSGVIQYGAREARSAYLTPASRGGEAILKHLGVKVAK